MRDDNILFKSNEQLSSIAKKYDIPEAYQIKAEEDTVKSVMDIAHLSGFKETALKYHYRSPDELIGFSNQSFYRPKGINLEAINDNIIPYKNTGRVMLNHIVSVDQNKETSSKTNIAEVKKIKQLIAEIKNDPILKDKSIAVLTFFNDQAELIRKEIEDEDIKVSIIDGIQGDERDIVIYSFVLKDPSSKRTYVPLTGEGGEVRREIAEGRVNVAFSRAKIQVHCVTSIPIDLWPEGVWIKKYLQYVENHGLVKRRHEKSEQQFDSKFEEQGFSFLAKNLNQEEYTMKTQVESLGFKIDLAIYKSGKKLAIEFDGPTHFEGGDGQVYVKEDWEREAALEVAGWTFYRVSFFDWEEDRASEEQAMLDFVYKFFNDELTLSKTNTVRALEAETAPPEEKRLEAYTASFSDPHNTRPAVSQNKSYQPSEKPSAKPKKPPETKPIASTELEMYLAHRIPGVITIKYAGSTPSWKELDVVRADRDRLYVKHAGASHLYQYRKDKIIDFK